METQTVELYLEIASSIFKKGPHGQIDFTWLTFNKLSIRQVETILEFHCQTKPRHKAGSNGFKSPGRRRCAPCVLHAKVTCLHKKWCTNDLYIY